MSSNFISLVTVWPEWEASLSFQERERSSCCFRSTLYTFCIHGGGHTKICTYNTMCSSHNSLGVGVLVTGKMEDEAMLFILGFPITISPRQIELLTPKENTGPKVPNTQLVVYFHDFVTSLCCTLRNAGYMATLLCTWADLKLGTPNAGIFFSTQQLTN